LQIVQLLDCLRFSGGHREVELIFGVVGHRKREPCQVVIADFGLAIEPGQLNQSRLGKNAEKLAATTYL